MAFKTLFHKVFDPELPKVYYELLFIGFSIIMGMSLSSSFLPLLADMLDPQGLLVGLVVSAWFFSRMFIELPAGIISDRLGRRRLLVAGLGLSLLGPVLCSQANHIYVLIFGRGVWGMGTALYFMSNMAMLMDILPTTSRGRALGLFQGIEFIGSFVGAPLGAWIATFISFTQVFLVTTAFMVLSFVVASRSKEMKGIGDSVQETSIGLKEISTSLRNWNILLVCSCNLFRMLIRQGLDQTVLLLYLNKVQALTVSQIGWIVSMKVAGMIIFILIAGVASDMYGRKPVLITGFAVSTLALFLFTRAGSFPLLLLSGFIGGVGDGLDMSTLMALLTDLTPQNVRGGAVGLFRTFMDVGGFTGPIIYMMTFTKFSSLSPFYLGIAMYALNMLLIARIKN